MMRALVVICLVIGLVAGDPVARTSLSSKNSGYDVKENSVLRKSRRVSDITALAKNVRTALVGVGDKVEILLSDNTLADFFELLAIIILCVVDAVTAVITVMLYILCMIANNGQPNDECTLKYEELNQLSQLRSVLTPERLDVAERLLLRVVKRFAEEKNIF